jgi:hypothetical protein
VNDSAFAFAHVAVDAGELTVIFFVIINGDDFKPDSLFAFTGRAFIGLAPLSHDDLDDLLLNVPLRSPRTMRCRLPAFAVCTGVRLIRSPRPAFAVSM